MIFDTRLLGIHHGLIMLGSFVAVWLALSLWRHYQLAWFKVPLLKPAMYRPQMYRPQIYRAGLVIIAAVVLMASLVLNDLWLLLSLMAAAGCIATIGTRDERTPISAGHQLGWQVVIALIIVAGGWTIPYVSHPLDHTIIDLSWSQWGRWIIPGSFLAVIWLVGLMNTINWLDGIDGLASAVGSVAFLTLAGVSLLPSTQDKQTLVLALIGAGAMLAFLWWNWFPARLYLGTSGSWFLGLYLGLVAMIGGGKIATTLLVLAWPAVDALLVIGQRIVNRQLPWEGDSSHFHYRLIAQGWTPRSITIIAALTSLVCGLAAISLQTQHKVAVTGLIALTMLVIIVTLKR